MLKFYNAKFKKFVDRGAIRKLSQEELDHYQGPISYVTHHPVFKQESTTTLLRIVTNSSFINENARLSPNGCMQEGPNALLSLLEVLIGFRMNEGMSDEWYGNGETLLQIGTFTDTTW